MAAFEYEPAGLSLCDVVCRLRTTERCEQFLEDVLSPVELERLEIRWRIFKMLHQGMPQIRIREHLGVGRATVTRANRVYRRGTGILKEILDGGEIQ